MKDFCIFVKSIEYAEQNLCSDITQEDIAGHCCCSVSALQKMWKYCSRHGIMGYIKKRRLVLAAHDLINGAGILDTAMKYGYGSNEAFTRAFRGLYGVNPSEFSRTRRFTDIYPRFDEKYMTGGNFMGRKFDLTELYEKLIDKKDTYIACFDVKSLMWINDNLGRNLGDAVIQACISRIDSALDGDMFAFRIGGDEFAVVTGFTDIEQAKAFESKVTAENDMTVEIGGVSAPVFLHSGLMLYSDHEQSEDFHEIFEKSLIRK